MNSFQTLRRLFTVSLILLAVQANNRFELSSLIIELTCFFFYLNFSLLMLTRLLLISWLYCSFGWMEIICVIYRTQFL